MFIIAASICVIGGTFCNLFVSGKQQPWNNLHHTQTKEDGLDKEEEDLLVEPSTGPINFDDKSDDDDLLIIA